MNEINDKDQNKKPDFEELIQKRQEIDQELEKTREDVTIILSDIVSYTKFVDSHGDIAGRLIAERHNKLFMNTISKYGGVYIKSIGDAVMVRFPKPGPAVEATCSILRKMKDDNKGKGKDDQLHLRIGIATGKAIIEANDVNGNVVNLSARLGKKAPYDGMLICHQTFEGLDKFMSGRCLPEEEMTVRGIESGAVRAYKVVWETEGPAKIPEPVEDALVLDISSDGEKLKLSLHTDGKGQETVSSYEELPINEEKIKKACDQITQTLKRATTVKGEKSLDMLVSAGQTLYDVLLTSEIKTKLSTSEINYLVFNVQDSLVHIPWELLHDGQTFLCLKFATGRRVFSRVKPSDVKRPGSLRPKVTIISDPCGNLSAAEREGRILLERLSSNERISVALKSGAKQDYIRNTLRDSEIIHFCGHADYIDEDPLNSGWLLADGKLTASDISQMAESKSVFPLLIFANACQSGRTEEWAHQGQNMLFGLASAFLHAGVQHYIGTIWDVLDQGSEEFASKFYESLLEGKTIGMAQKDARNTLFKNGDEGILVWASYVFYGNPASYVFGIPDVTTEKEEKPDKKSEEKPKEPEPVLASPEPAAVRTAHAISAGAEKSLAKQFFMFCGMAIVLIALLYAIFSMNKDSSRQTIIQPPAGGGEMPPLSKTEEALTFLSNRVKTEEYQKLLETQDDWTSRMMTVAVMPFEKYKTTDGDIDKVRSVIEREFSGATGFKIVERDKLDKILEEQKIGASDLADPETLARLGKLKFAKLFFVGKLLKDEDDSVYLSFRLFDTETSANVSPDLIGGASPAVDIGADSAKTAITNIRNEYPVRGRILEVLENEIFLNIGSDNGLEKDDSFYIIQNPEEKDGKAFDLMRKAGKGIITEVADGAAVGKVEEKSIDLKKDLRIQIK